MSKPVNVPIEVQKPEQAQNTTSHDGPRLVPGRNGGTLTPFTPETSRLARQTRIEKKRALIRAAAQQAVENGNLKQQYKGWAWLAEVAQTQMRIATTPEAGKASTLAAGWLVDNAGLSEKQKDADASSPADDPLRELGRKALEFLIRREEAR